MNKASQDKIWRNIILGVFGIALCLFVIGLVLYILLRQHFPCDAGNIATIYATIAGGLCTMIGVILTISYEYGKDRRLKTENNKPEIFIPAIYDIAKADRIRLFNKDESKKDSDKMPNNNVYFQNSEKVDFRLMEVETENGCFCANSFFVEKNELICLSFYTEKKENQIIKLHINALDNTSYVISLNLNNHTITIEEKE